MRMPRTAAGLIALASALSWTSASADELSQLAMQKPTAVTTATTLTSFVQEQISTFMGRDGEATSPWEGYARMLGSGTATRWDGLSLEWFAWADSGSVITLDMNVVTDDITAQKIRVSGYKCPEGRCDTSLWSVDATNEIQSSLRLFPYYWTDSFCPPETADKFTQKGLGCKHAEMLQDLGEAFKGTGAFTDFTVIQVF